MRWLKLKHLPSSLITWFQSLWPTWSKERANQFLQSSELSTYVLVCVCRNQKGLDYDVCGHSKGQFKVLCPKFPPWFHHNQTSYLINLDWFDSFLWISMLLRLWFTHLKLDVLGSKAQPSNIHVCTVDLVLDSILVYCPHCSSRAFLPVHSSLHSIFPHSISSHR